MVEELKVTYPTVFSEPVFPVPRSIDQQHRIDLVPGNNEPPRKKLYPLDQEELTELKARVAEPLTRLTRKGVKFEWSDDQQAAFGKIK